MSVLTVGLTCHTEAEHSNLVAQAVGDVDLVKPGVCSRHSHQDKGAGGGGALHTTGQLLQDHSCCWEADGLAADGDVLSLRDDRRWKNEDGGVPGRSWTKRRELYQNITCCSPHPSQLGGLEIKLLF